MGKITVVVKEVGKDAEVREIEHTLESMQSIVGGYIEDVPIGDNVHIICNEEGRLATMSVNLETEEVFFLGNLFFCSQDGIDFCSLTEGQIEYAMNYCTLYDAGDDE